MKTLILSSIIAMGFFVSAIRNNPEKSRVLSGSLSVEFNNTVDGAPLILGNKTYKNAHGDAFTITEFKYYISNIKLTDEQGNRVTIPESYYLVDQSNLKSLKINLTNVPAATYKKISFIIGVDSLRNLRGSQTGALDPANKMYWSWNSGYIFVKLTGISPQAPEHKLRFDVGGIQPNTNTIRSQSFNLLKPVAVTAKSAAKLKFDVNAAALFKGKETIDFATMNRCMGGPKAVVIANNYQNGMFRLSRPISN